MGGWKRSGERVGEYRARNGTKGTLRLLNCARTCVPLSFFDFVRLLHFPFPRSTYIYIYTSFMLFLDSTTRENNDSATYSSLPRVTFPFFTDSNFSPLERGGIILFKQKVTRECQRERKRYTWNRGLFPSLPLKLCFRTNSNRRRKREREGLFEKGSAKFS